MRRAAISVLILACAVYAAALRADPLPLARDLAAAGSEARAKRVPVLIAFTTRTCPYCRVARRDHLEPLSISPQWRNRVVMLDMQIDNADALIDFEGKTTTTRAFAQRLGVRSVPTLIVFDADGNAVTAPLVGLMTRDYYSLYIERAMELSLIHI